MVTRVEKSSLDSEISKGSICDALKGSQGRQAQDDSCCEVWTGESSVCVVFHSGVPETLAIN